MVVVLCMQSISYAEIKINSNELFQLAKKHNINYVLLKRQLKRAWDKYELKKSLATSIADDISKHEDVSYEQRVIMALDPLTTKKEYLDTKYKLIQLTNNIKTEAIANYFELFILERDEKIKEEFYRYMDEKNKVKDVELEVGQITALDKKIFEQSYKQAYAEYLQSSAMYADKKRNVNLFINRKPESELNLEGSNLPRFAFVDVDLSKMVDKMMDNSYRIKALELQRNIFIEEKKSKTRFKGFGETQIEMDILDDKISEITVQIDDEKRSMEKDLYVFYQNAEIALTNYKINSIQHEINAKNYDVAKLKFENGLMSVLDLKAAYNRYQESNYRLMQAQLNEYINIKKFYDFIDENSVDITQFDK